jgi:hypothetical protein
MELYIPPIRLHGAKLVKHKNNCNLREGYRSDRLENAIPNCVLRPLLSNGRWFQGHFLATGLHFRLTEFWVVRLHDFSSYRLLHLVGRCFAHCRIDTRYVTSYVLPSVGHKQVLQERLIHTVLKLL